MSIAALTRVILCGIAHEKEDVLSALQDLGCLHLVPLREPGPLQAPDAEERRSAYAAYKHLGTAPRQLRPWPHQKGFDLQHVIDAALANKERLRVARDRRDFLRHRIAGLKPFGDFEFPPEDALRGRKLWFYVVPIKERRALASLELPWAIVGRDNTRLFVAVISKDEPPAGLLPVPRTHTGARPLSALLDDLVETEIEIENVETEHIELTRQRLPLGLHLARAEDADDLRMAAGMTRDEGAVFGLMGWAPVSAVDDIMTLVEERGLAVSFEDVGPEDEPPTLLDNPGRFEGASALTTFYMTPSYSSWDPSLIIFFSFAVFFAMILADAGYALLMAGGLALYWKRLSASPTGIRLRNILAVVVGVSVLFGVFAGSYFSFAPEKDSPLGRIAFIDLRDIETMMAVSIVIGVLHISLANAVVAIRNWGTGLAVVKLGWIAATFGGLLIWLIESPAGYYILVAGLVAVFIGSGMSRRIESLKDWPLRLFDGASGLTGVTKLFGDILSYMRLFALGLASASMGATFNTLSSQIAEGLPGLGVLLAILLFLFGHAVNLALGVMSGVVHGLRLNVIEFFGWGLTEEGYPFKAFARREAEK